MGAFGRVGEEGSHTIPAFATPGHRPIPTGDDAMGPAATNPGRVHPLALAAVAGGLVASALALYGSFLSEEHIAGSPLNVARNRPGSDATRESNTTRHTLQLVAYVLPFVLGVGAALAGGEAMRAIERADGAYAGSLPAVFGIMIGGLSAVVSGCMILAVYGWRYVPALYTT